MRPLALALLLAAAGQATAADVLIRNARVHTLGAAGTLDGASILVRGGRVAQIGASIAVPPGVEVVDAAGGAVTPGLFDADTQLGLREIDGVDESVDDSSGWARSGATFDVVDGLNPRSTLVAITRAEGVTRAVAAPTPGERTALLAGFGAVLDLGSVRGFVMRPRVALYMVAGEGGAGRIGGSRPAAFAWLREIFEEARNPKLWMGRPNREPLLSPLEAAALQPVLDGRVPLVVNAHRAADLQTLLRVAADYKVRLVIQGGVEAHVVAAELAARKVPVILDPTDNLPSRFEMLAARDDAAAVLHRAGVLIALSGDSSHNARNVRQLAGDAVARGLPWDAALAAITLNPARIFGVDAAVGSIEAGKAADLVLWDGDPLEVTSYPRKVWIDGVAAAPETRQTRLRDRYLQRLPR